LTHYGTAEPLLYKDFVGAAQAPKPAPFQQGEIAVDRKPRKNYPCGCNLVVP
jgi:hypothetical protein